MKVLISIFEELYPLSGGGSPRVSNIARAFARKGHQVVVAGGIAASDAEAKEYLGCQEIVRLKSVSRLDPAKMKKYLLAHPINILKTIRAIRKYKPDIVISHNTIAGYGALLGKRFSAGKPFLVLDLTDVLFEYLDDYSSGGWLKAVQKLGRKMETASIRGSDRIQTISRAMKEITAEYGVGPDSIDVVSDGVDLEIFQRCPAEELRNRIASDKEAVIAFQGVIDPQDGPDLLVAAARKVVAKHPKAAFWVIGGGTAIPGLKKEVENAGLEEAFYFSGWVPQKEVARYLSVCDIGLVILPDIVSARGRVTLKEFEYWACGISVVAPRLPGLEEVIEENVTGLFYKPGDSAEMAEKIVTLIEDKKLSRRLAETGEKLVHEKYRWDRLADEIVGLCEGYVKG